MKTATAQSLLAVLFVLICSFVTGCQQQVSETVENPTPPAGSQDQTDPSQNSNDPTKPMDNTISEVVPSVSVDGSHQEASNNTAVADNDSSDDTDGTLDQTLEPSAELADTPVEPTVDTPAEPTIDIPASWKRLSDQQEIWLDTKNKQVIVGGKVCLDVGPLEMLICPKNTKEHESIISVNVASWQVHAALVALGSSPGVPCRWAPEYTPAWGPTINIQMMYRDAETKQVKTIDGKQWILNTDTQKPMTTDLVFGGSFHQPDPEGRRAQYMADAGELICLANFATATIDIRAPDPDKALFFEANTALIPPINTQVYTVISAGPVVGKPDE